MKQSIFSFAIALLMTLSLEAQTKQSIQQFKVKELNGKIATTSNQSAGTNWSNAITMFDNLVISGFSDWCFPSINELQPMWSNIKQGASASNCNIGSFQDYY